MDETCKILSFLQRVTLFLTPRVSPLCTEPLFRKGDTLKTDVSLLFRNTPEQTTHQESINRITVRTALALLLLFKGFPDISSR